VLSWFKRKKSYPEVNSLTVDIHSHLLPALDDGVKTVEEAAEIILRFEKLGYKKIITTPHVMSDAYRNTPEVILEKLKVLKMYLAMRGILMEIEAAAEYYLDEHLISQLEANQKILTFGKNYLLFETNFLTEPLHLKEFIFLATTKGYKPVLAHPERYLYLQNNIEKMQDLLDRGVLFQLNISSVTGYYSKQVKQAAIKLIERKWVHFLGSDCHHIQHIKLMEDATQLRHYRQALSLPLLNNSLS
jgi:tyrosine-protein phosphatase YwqE